jgi:hypothetical protein
VHESWRAGFGPLWLLDMNNDRISEYRSRVARKVRYMINAATPSRKILGISKNTEWDPSASISTHHTSNYTMAIPAPYLLSK